MHCRRTNVPERGDELFELPAKEFTAILGSLVDKGRPPLVVFSGGEPLMRSDLPELLACAKGRGIPFAIATNGALVDAAVTKMLASYGPHRVSVSLDGARAATHDDFRGEKGSFDKAINALKLFKEAGISTQLNCSVSARNVSERDEIVELARELGAAALHFFLLVPVGCGAELPDSMRLGAENYEEFLLWLMGTQAKPLHPSTLHPSTLYPLPSTLEIRATCAPHQTRIVRQKVSARSPEFAGRAAMMRGCLAGSVIAFISHKGEVFPCGYLPVPAGDLKKQTFWEIWENSEVFKTISDPGALKGKCGTCEFKVICGGCRARAFGTTGDYMGQEPYCLYEPGKRIKAKG
ncbi:MAG: radical SAM protein [Elusimicrobia bacterium]|nr:radical SAM protein [Elusimicrobiota bacterium]